MTGDTTEADSDQQHSDSSTVTETGETTAELDAETGERSTLTRRAALALTGITGAGVLAGGAARAGGSRNGTTNSRPWNQDVDAQGHSLLNLGELEMAEGGAPICDFEGENLHVGGNGLRASSKVTCGK